MRKYLLTLAAVACLTSHAQIAQVNSTEPLLRGVEKEMYYPVLSQDGTKLLFTSSNCQGLKMYDFNDDVTIKISEAERAGLELPYESVYFGSSDAAAVTKLGVPAATLAAMNPGPPRYYHTRLDKADILVPETIEKVIDIALQTVFDFDEAGI